MDNLLQLELLLIASFQSLGGWLVPIMKGLSFLGQEEFYLLVFPIVFWCMDTRLGIRMALILLASGYLNCSLKVLFHAPRPYWISSTIQYFSSEPTFGFPSGHAQNAAALWGITAVSIKKKWAYISFGVVIIAIGLSRIYLGVHFPNQVLAGWLTGLLLLTLFLYFEKPAADKFEQLSFKTKVISIISLSLGLMVILYALIWSQRGFDVRSLILNPNLTELPDPLSSNDAFTFAGILMGLGLGVTFFEQQFQKYIMPTQPGKMILRYLIGAAGILLLWSILGSIFPRNNDLISYALRFLRYALIGLWIAYLAPYVYKKANL
jgi:membrane-associated phospholipid phosphatase